MTQKLLLNSQLIWMIFIWVFKNTIQIKKCKILIAFDYVIADRINNKKLNPVTTESFIRGRKLKISFIFIMQPYFDVAKSVRLNSTHYFNMKRPNKQELQQIAFNH